MNGRTRAVVLAALLAVAPAVAGCGGSPGTPAPSGSSGTPAAAASVDGSALAASFVKVLSDPALHANVVQQATATADQGGEPLDFRVTMRAVLALPDVDMELVIEAGGQSTRFRVVAVGDRTFADLGEGWVAAPPGSVDTTELTKAVVVVTDPSDLQFVGSEQVGGRTLYHLVTTRPLPYTPAGFAGSGTGTGTMNDLDAYVEADGTPVRIELSFTATGTSGAGSTTVNGTTDLLFSDVGGSQVVVAPTLAPSPAPSAGASVTPSAVPEPSTAPTPAP